MLLNKYSLTDLNLCLGIARPRKGTQRSNFITWSAGRPYHGSEQNKEPGEHFAGRAKLGSPLGNSKSHIQFAARSRVTIGHNAGQAVPARRLFFQIVYECLPDRVHPQPTTSAFPIVFMKPTTTPSIFAVPSGKVPLGPARITR